jgi:ABC-type bacteriocin/lantibiotic exporters, contain an N-terminal double-glycine peptidase domain
LFPRAHLARDTGASQSDGLTTLPRITGRVVGSPAVSILVGLDATPGFEYVDLRSLIRPDGSFALTTEVVQGFAGGVLADGPHSIHVQATDAAGTSARVDARFTLDTTVPTLSAALVHDTGAMADDGLTRDPTSSGSLADTNGVASFVAALDGAAGHDLLSTLQADGSFNLDAALFSTLADGSMQDGAHVLHLTAADAAGSHKTTALAFTLDTRTPATPTFDLAQASDTGDLGDHRTEAAVVTLAGTTDPGATLSLFAGRQTTIAGTDGTVQFTGVPRAEGSNTLTVRAVDAAGNVSAFSIDVERLQVAGNSNAALDWKRTTLAAIQRDGHLRRSPPATWHWKASRCSMRSTPSAAGRATWCTRKRRRVHRRMRRWPPLARAPSSLTSIRRRRRRSPRSIRRRSPASLTGRRSAIGEDVAQQLIALRAGDGWDAFVTYTGSTTPGQWRPTAPNFDPALLPQWATLTPFAMTSPDQFRLDGPPDLTSQAYGDAVNETKSLGSATESTRTEDQTEIARFWANGVGTYTPPGQWNQIAGETAATPGRVEEQAVAVSGTATDVAIGAGGQFSVVSGFAVDGSADGVHTFNFVATDAAGSRTTDTLAVSLPSLVPFTITGLTPASGASETGVTQRPKITFSRAVDVTTLTADSFYATDSTGAKLAATADATGAWLFLANPMPGAYFQSRQVGDSVARVRELENIRPFLTSSVLTLVIDLAFTPVGDREQAVGGRTRRPQQVSRQRQRTDAAAGATVAGLSAGEGVDRPAGRYPQHPAGARAGGWPGAAAGHSRRHRLRARHLSLLRRRPVRFRQEHADPARPAAVRAGNRPGADRRRRYRGDRRVVAAPADWRGPAGQRAIQPLRPRDHSARQPGAADAARPVASAAGTGDRPIPGRRCCLKLLSRPCAV